MRLSFRQLEILQIVMDTYSATETARTLNSAADPEFRLRLSGAVAPLRNA
jgi:hypothetical protein